MVSPWILFRTDFKKIQTEINRNLEIFSFTYSKVKNKHNFGQNMEILAAPLTIDVAILMTKITFTPTTCSPLFSK